VQRGLALRSLLVPIPHIDVRTFGKQHFHDLAMAVPHGNEQRGTAPVTVALVEVFSALSCGRGGLQVTTANGLGEPGRARSNEDSQNGEGEHGELGDHVVPLCCARVSNEVRSSREPATAARNLRCGQSGQLARAVPCGRTSITGRASLYVGQARI
jgi:hypothetical protein